MTTKPVIISSSGLKNIVLTKYKEEEYFSFKFGDQEFQMNNIFAEFISPVVSHLHQTDPTINYLNFEELIKSKNGNIKKISQSLLTPDTISLLLQISSGSSIEIDESQALKLRLLSIFLGNEELHSKLNEQFPPNNCEENVNVYLKNLEFLYDFSLFETGIDFSKAIEFIASHFYELDVDEFLKLPSKIQYMIISHHQLQIESEDSLFDIISQVIETKRDENEIDDILFLEQIEFIGLSEEKFHEFIDEFDINEISGQLWHNLSQRFLVNSTRKLRRHAIKNKKVEIIVSGWNKYFQLGVESNNLDKTGDSIISPPEILSFDSSSILSYSIYGRRSVLVMNDGKLMGIGDNEKGQISSSLQKDVIDHYTEFSINDDKGIQLIPISAVCCQFGTLYMLSKSDGIERQLVLCDRDINEGTPIFLDIGNHSPIDIFGGSKNAAAICKEGEVIFINRSSVQNSPDSQIEAIYLPDGEKASSVACCNDSVVVLSSNGRVFSSSITKHLNFAPVSELDGEEIVFISGTNCHCLAVNKEGRVFGRGSNGHGELGLGKGIILSSSFTEILSLKRYKIRAAYSGFDHSLFETREGKILACGNDECGQLLLKSGSFENAYLPIETAIKGNASFCIAGSLISAVFINNNPPPNTPTTRVQQNQ